MPSIDYTSSGGGFSASVPGGAGYGLPGGGVPPGMEWLVQIAKRKADQEAAMRQLQLDAARAQRGPKLGGRDVQQETKDQLALQREIAQTRAITDPAPTRRSFILNSTGAFDTLDENAMSGAQRQMFLPQNATFSGADERDVNRQRYAREDDLLGRAASAPPPQAPPESIAEMAARMYPRTQSRGAFGGGGSLGSRGRSGGGLGY